MFFKTFFGFYHNSTICDINQGYKRVMSDGSEDDRWKIAVQKIEDMELLTDLEDRKTNLYDPNFCYSDNEDASHVIGNHNNYIKQSMKYR